MLKVFAVIILILIVLCVVLFLIIKSQKLKIKQLEIKTEGYKNSYFELNNRFEQLNKEMEIEKNHNKELAKKLADISCMSIDDVLLQLQNNNSGKDSL